MRRQTKGDIAFAVACAVVICSLVYFLFWLYFMKGNIR